MGNKTRKNRSSYQINLKQHLVKWLLNLTVVFTFFVQSVFADGFFPQELSPSASGNLMPDGLMSQQVVYGSFGSDTVPVVFRTTEPMDINSYFQNGVGPSQLTLPINTYFQIETPLEAMTGGFFQQNIQNGQDSFLSDLLYNVSIYKLFREVDSHENSPESSSSIDRTDRTDRTEKNKLYRQKVKIIDSTNETLVGKELEIEMSKEKLKKLERQKDSPGIVLRSDFNGSPDWNPDAKGNGSKNTQAGIGCASCGSAPTSAVDSGKRIKDGSIETYINYIFEKTLLSKEDKAFKDDMKKTIDFAMKNKFKKSQGVCYAKVKDALLHSRITPKRLWGEYAKQAGPLLEDLGFVNLLDKNQVDKNPRIKGIPFHQIIDTPYLAPKGAILVYEPDPKDRVVWLCRNRKKTCKSNERYLDEDAGHIELKTEVSGSGGFVSDYYNSNPRTGNSMQADHRKLVGVYYKL